MDRFSRLAREMGIDLDHELTSGFAARRARFKARQLVDKAWFTPSDRPELEQELKLAILLRLHKFTPERGCWEAFVNMVIAKRIATILRWRRAKKRGYRQYHISLSIEVEIDEDESCELSRLVGPEHKECLTGRYVSSNQECYELSHDLKVLLRGLPSNLRTLARRLKKQSLATIVETTGVSFSTLSDWMAKLRIALANAGFGKIPESSGETTPKRGR